MFDQHILVGNLGKDPELSYSPQGKAICELSLAVNRKRGDADETTWYKVTAWGDLAERCNKYLAKGKQVLVSGDGLKVSVWKGKDGEARATVELTARDVRFLGGAAGGEQAEEELPF